MLGAPVGLPSALGGILQREHRLMSLPKYRFLRVFTDVGCISPSPIAFLGSFMTPVLMHVVMLAGSAATGVSYRTFATIS